MSYLIDQNGDSFDVRVVGLDLSLRTRLHAAPLDFEAGA